MQVKSFELAAFTCVISAFMFLANIVAFAATSKTSYGFYTVLFASFTWASWLVYCRGKRIDKITQDNAANRNVKD